MPRSVCDRVLLTSRIEEMKHDAESRLKFLKMVTPRRPSKEAENKVYRYLAPKDA